MSPEPSTDAAHWTLCEGNMSEQSYFVATVIGVNSFTVVMPYSVSHSIVTPIPYYKTYTSFYQGTYTRSGTTATVTSSNHGLVSGFNSNVFGYFDVVDDSFVGSYSVTGSSNSVAITFASHGYVTGESVNLKFMVDNDNPAVDVGGNLITPYYTPNNGKYIITKISNDIFTITNSSVLNNITGNVMLMDKSENKGKYFRVEVIDVNTFNIDTSSIGKSSPVGDHFYWVKAEDAKPKFDRQISLRNASFNISGLNIEITGIDGHSLQPGNIIVLENGTEKFFTKVSSITTSSITAVNTGVENGDIIDLVYSFDQFDSPEITYKSLTTNIYPNFL